MKLGIIMKIIIIKINIIIIILMIIGLIIVGIGYILVIHKGLRNAIFLYINIINNYTKIKFSTKYKIQTKLIILPLQLINYMEIYIILN